MFYQYPPRPKYQHIEPLGAGAMGEVFRARRLSDNAEVAIKYLRDLDWDARQRFQREANNYLRQQSCPYIVNILDYNFTVMRPYIVLEFCQFGSARAYVSKFWWEPDKLAALLTHVAAAIESIHLTGGFHRDIKPDNLLLTLDAEGHLVMKLSDFGLARLPWGLFGSLLTRTPAGTPEYIAPEVLQGGQITAAADIFSFGVTIHELFTGVRPAAGATSLSCPSALRSLVQRMISTEPERRPSIQVVRVELREAAKVIKSQQQGLKFLAGAALVAVVAALLRKGK